MQEKKCAHDYFNTNKVNTIQNGFRVEVGSCQKCGEELSRRLICDPGSYTQIRGPRK